MRTQRVTCLFIPCRLLPRRASESYTQTCIIGLRVSMIARYQCPGLCIGCNITSATFTPLALLLCIPGRDLATLRHKFLICLLEREITPIWSRSPDYPAPRSKLQKHCRRVRHGWGVCVDTLQGQNNLQVGPGSDRYDPGRLQGGPALLKGPRATTKPARAPHTLLGVHISTLADRKTPITRQCHRTSLVDRPHQISTKISSTISQAL